MTSGYDRRTAGNLFCWAAVRGIVHVDPFDGGLVVGHVGGAAAGIVVSERALVSIDWARRELQKLFGSRV